MKSIESDTGKMMEAPVFYQSEISFSLKKLQWAAARLLFMASMIFGTATIIGFFLLAPIYSYWFFGTFRFWRHMRIWPRMIAYGYYFAYIYLKGDFVLSIPYAAPPMTRPSLNVVQLNPAWSHGSSCAECSQCCRKIKCPLVKESTGYCMSYNSFYWRYFNCGRYPTTQTEIDRYGCPKWVVRS